LRPPQQFKARFQPAWWLGPSEYSASAGGHP
jgi:hypothetical protein